MSDKLDKPSSASDYNQFENYEAIITSRQFTNLFNHIVGKLLTLADATFIDKDQREAFKSLIKTNIWEINDPLQKWMYETGKKHVAVKNEDYIEPGKGGIFPF